MRAESFMPEAALEELTKTTAAYADQLPEDMLISSYNLRLLDSIGTGKQGRRYVYFLTVLNCRVCMISVSSYTSYCILLTV